MIKRFGDVYEIRGRFQRSARIDTDLNIEEPLAGFSLNDSAWEVLRQVFFHLATSQQRAFTWTGPYGAGKSSLAIYLSALLGTDEQLRNQAAKKLGKNRYATLFRDHTEPKKGWVVIPVVGSRNDPITSIREGLKTAVQKKWPARKPNSVKRAVNSQNGSELIDGLIEVAEAASKSGDGLVIIFDEMGKALEGIAEEGGDLQFFQELSEAFSRTDAKCLMVGVLHQAFQEYVSRAKQSVRNEWAKVQGRFVDIPFSVSLEDVVALVGEAIDGPKPKSEVVKLGAQAIRDIDHPRYKGIKGFERKLAGCWPLHPLTALMLGPLSRAKFGQNERSTFSFLSSSEPRGFRTFLLEQEISDSSAYLPHWLFEYLQFNLEPAILASSDSHRWSEAMDAIERAKKLENELAESIAKLIGLLDLYGRTFGLAASDKLIRLCFPRQTKRKIDFALKALKDASIAVYRRHLGAWALFAGSDIDIDEAVQLASARLGDDLNSLKPYLPSPKPIVAKRHYHETGTLRWFTVQILSASEVNSKFETLLKDSGQSGSFVLLIPGEDIDSAELQKLSVKYANKAKYKGVALAFGTPKNVGNLLEAVHDAAVLERVLTTTPELEQDAVAHRELGGRLNVARNRLRDITETCLEEAEWHLPSNPKRAKKQVSATKLASDLADTVYFMAPILHNELVNRDKPSSNAVAARRNLLHLMIKGGDVKDLGINGYPAELGLYKSLLEAPKIHRPTTKDEAFWTFARPDGRVDRARSFTNLWDDFEEFLKLTETERKTFADLYERWRQPPFGLRHGVMPVLAVTLVLAHQDEIALYVDGLFSPSMDDYFINRLLQSPDEMEFRRFRVVGVRQEALQQFAEMVATSLTDEKPSTPLTTAKPLAKFAFRLPQWVKRTKTLDAQTMEIRDVLLNANDPNILLFVDLPRACGLDVDFTEKAKAEQVDEVIKKLRAAITDLGSAHERMLETLADALASAFDIKDLTQLALDDLSERGGRIAGLTGDLRLDAFSRRLGSSEHRMKWLEGLGGLAANKPVRDWTDIDLERAKVEILALAKSFQRVERLLVSRAKSNRSIYLDGAIGYGKDSKEVDIAVSLNEKTSAAMRSLSSELRDVLEANVTEEQIKLAALVNILHSMVNNDDESEDDSGSSSSSNRSEVVK